MLQRKKVYLRTCAPNEALNHSVHLRSLIRVFVTRMNEPDILGYLNLPNDDSDLNIYKAQMSEVKFSGAPIGQIGTCAQRNW